MADRGECSFPNLRLFGVLVANSCGKMHMLQYENLCGVASDFRCQETKFWIRQV